MIKYLVGALCCCCYFSSGMAVIKADWDNVTVNAVYAKKPDEISKQQCLQYFSKGFFSAVAKNIDSDQLVKSGQIAAQRIMPVQFVSPSFQYNLATFRPYRLRIYSYLVSFPGVEAQTNALFIFSGRGKELSMFGTGGYFTTQYCDFIISPALMASGANNGKTASKTQQLPSHKQVNAVPMKKEV